MKVKYKDIKQYLLLYLMMIVNQSCLYVYKLNSDNIRLIMLLFFSGMLFAMSRKKFVASVWPIFVLLACVIVTRFISGGVGLSAWVDMAIPIVLCIYTVTTDRDGFLTRFVNIIVLFAGISLIMYAVQIAFPGLLRRLLTSYNTEFYTRTWESAESYTTNYSRGYGLFLYTFRDEIIPRNKGIYTEAGVCQMVYNAALFVLFFLRDKVHITGKKVNRYIFILLIALITVQSTTGYVITGLMVATVLLMHSSKREGYRRYLIWTVVFGMVVLIGDFAVRGETSFLYSAFLSKLFGNEGFEIHQNGQVRIGAALVSLQTMISKPFGAGYSQVSSIISSTRLAGGGAGLFKFGAALGIVPFIMVILLYSVPVFRLGEKFSFKATLLIFVFLTLFAQSNPFYPFLYVFVPIIHYSLVEHTSKEVNEVKK